MKPLFPVEANGNRFGTESHYQAHRHLKVKRNNRGPKFNILRTHYIGSMSHYAPSHYYKG